MKYIVTIQVTRDYFIEVSAKNEESAEEKAFQYFEKNKNTLLPDDENEEVTEIEENE